eukprot:1711684-Pyramimonas_sp.AAC.1
MFTWILYSNLFSSSEGSGSGSGLALVAWDGPRVSGSPPLSASEASPSTSSAPASGKLPSTRSPQEGR